MSWFDRGFDKETLLWKDKDWAIVMWLRRPLHLFQIPNWERISFAVYHRKHDGWSTWGIQDKEYMSIGQMKDIIVPGYVTKKMKYFVKIRRLL